MWSYKAGSTVIGAEDGSGEQYSAHKLGSTLLDRPASYTFVESIDFYRRGCLQALQCGELGVNFVPHQLGGDWSAEINNHWWPNQRSALDMAFTYLESRTEKQAMIRMPTGTGKTAVIAALARLLEDHPRTLVVAPWKGLVHQLEREIRVRFWEKASLFDAVPHRSVQIAKPRNIATCLQDMPVAGTIICTYQALQAIESDAALFGQLKAWVSLTLADEGHREPAPRWAQAVRNLESPTILFTATPYRNDLQLFDLDSAHYYAYTYPEARDASIVRDVAFQEADWPEPFPQSVAPFVEVLRNCVEQLIANDDLDRDEFRAIIRCDEESHIREIVNELIAKGESAIGVHETFDSANVGALIRTAPDPQTQTARYWVHQYKLLEGLDDPRFRLVALHGSFRNARNLVQQVGRVIRNPGHLPGKTAHVLSKVQSGQPDLWNRFLEYENAVKERVQDGKWELDVVGEYLSSLANGSRFYLLGDFRKQLTPDSFVDPRDVVKMRKTVIALICKPTFSWDGLVKCIRKDFKSEETIPYGPAFEGPETILQLFVVSKQSEFTTEAFLNCELGYVFAKKLDQHVYFYSTAGGIPDYLKRYAAPIEPDAMGKLFVDGATKIGEVSLINGDFGNHSFRRRVLSTASLEMVPPTLSDYVQICSTATGTSIFNIAGQSVPIRRYVGFTRGRVAERTNPSTDFVGFDRWLIGLHDQLQDAGAHQDEVFSRYAQYSSPNPQSQPIHVLFDVSSESLDFTNLTPIDQPVGDEDLWRVNQSQFVGEIDGVQFNGSLQFDAKIGEYVIRLAGGYISMLGEHGTSTGYIDHLNRNQDFRLLMSDDSIYCQGQFFRPNTMPWKGGGSRLNITQIIHGCASLKDVPSEKGALTDDWSTGVLSPSVFGSIIDPGGVFQCVGWTPEILLCGDVASPEVADFFALDPDSKRIVMIHAKNAKTGSKMSASAFHDVCSQATRYLRFFNPGESKARMTASQIRSKWCPNANLYSRQERLVWSKKQKKADAVATALNSAVADVSYRREVWIVMGNGLSKARFSQAMAKQSPEPNEKELSYLLQSTWSAVASCGASLSVFCMD